ncbi:MAG: hypothetical protein M5U34_36675 [Chloroflexi bacterium]|nr:hypothetical protein [Chloroflexota bacterium]
MTSNLSDALHVYDSQNGKSLARIALNGYDISAGGLFPDSGVMRSFVLLEGDLWDQWNAVQPIILQHESGAKVTVRVAALPVEDDGYGLIEFL